MIRLQKISGDSNVVVGYQTGYSNTGDFNTLLGYRAGFSNNDINGNSAKNVF